MSTELSFLSNSFSINIYLNNCLLGNKESPKCCQGNHIKNTRNIIFNVLLVVESMPVQLFLKAFKKYNGRICWIVSLVVIRSVKSVAHLTSQTSLELPVWEGSRCLMLLQSICSCLKVQLCFHTAPRHFYTCTPIWCSDGSLDLSLLKWLLCYVCYHIHSSRYLCLSLTLLAFIWWCLSAACVGLLFV